MTTDPNARAMELARTLPQHRQTLACSRDCPGCREVTDALLTYGRERWDAALEAGAKAADAYGASCEHDPDEPRPQRCSVCMPAAEYERIYGFDGNLGAALRAMKE